MRNTVLQSPSFCAIKLLPINLSMFLSLFSCRAHKLSLDSALGRVRAHRPCASPNDGFLAQVPGTCPPRNVVPLEVPTFCCHYCKT